MLKIQTQTPKRRHSRHGVATPEAKARQTAKKAQTREYARDLSGSFPFGFYADGRPKPKDQRVRDEKASDAVKFLEHYFPERFYLPFTAGQIEEIRTAERVIQEGGQFAFAAPRGDGKTTRIEALALFAVLNGLRSFVVVVSADAAASQEIMDSIKTELRTNDRLSESYPEICIPTQLADDVALRARSMALHGVNMRFKWSKDEIIFPTIPGSTSSGAILKTRGLTGRLRGMKHGNEDGSQQRPDLFLLDDPQTDESANSETQCTSRERLVLGAVKGSGGPTERIAAFMPCTVIQRGDVAWRFLNRDLHPEWLGSLRKMIVQWPDVHSTLWQTYVELRRDAFRRKEANTDEATSFYVEHRAEMDAGAVLDNDLRIKPPAISALQTAYDIISEDGERVFLTEYQNDPPEDNPSIYSLTEAEVAEHQSGYQQGAVPEPSQFLVAMADVGRAGLHWCVAAFVNDMTGFVVDYGLFPGDKPLWDDGEHQTEHVQVAIFEALTRFVPTLLDDRAYTRKGARMPIDTVLIDCGYAMDAVIRFVRHARLPVGLLPSRGFGYRTYRCASGARHVKSGDNWDLREWTTQHDARVVCHNADYWRMLVQRAFKVPAGAKGSLSLYADNPTQHQRIAAHIAARKLVRHIPGGDRYDVIDFTEAAEDHWCDAVVGCCIAAQGLGAAFTNTAEPEKRQKSTAPKAIVRMPT